MLCKHRLPKNECSLCMTDNVISSVQTEEQKYPEHMKLNEIKDKSQACGEFLEWLSEQGIHLCTWEKEHTVNEGDENEEELPEGYYGVNKSTTKLLEEFFGIDGNKLEKEKRQMLNEIRAANQKR